MYYTVPNKIIHMQCSILLLQPNKRIGIVILFHLHLFLRIVIPFPNGIDIPRTKRGPSFRAKPTLPTPCPSFNKNEFLCTVLYFSIWALDTLFSLMPVGSSTMLFAFSLASYETLTSIAT